MPSSPATKKNVVTGVVGPAFDDFQASLLSFKADQTAIMNDILASNPSAFLIAGEDNTYIQAQSMYQFNMNGDTRGFYTINGMLVAEMKANKAKGPGQWVETEGVWNWALNPVVPITPQPANGAGSIPQQGAGKSLFGGDLNAAPGSLDEAFAALDTAVANVKSTARAKGAIQ